LPHHAWLLEADHDLAKQPADQHQQSQLSDENEFGRAARAFGGKCGHCGKRAWHHQHAQPNKRPSGIDHDLPAHICRL